MRPIPEIHITKYGVIPRADQLVPTAKYLAQLLSGQNKFSSRTVSYTDGSSVHVARFDHEYVATIWGGSESLEEKPPTTVLPILPQLVHGVVTSPVLIGQALTGKRLSEFTKSRQIRGRDELSRSPNAALRAPIPAVVYNVLNPDTFTTYAQAGSINPTMYSGSMRDAVQMALSMGDTLITYSPTFAVTHGLNTMSGSPQIVEISANGVMIGGLTTKELPKEMITGFSAGELARFGGVPDGKLPRAWTRLASETLMNALYDGANAVFDPLHGWVFNSTGDVAMIVMEYGNEDDGYVTQLHTITITYNPVFDEFSAELVSTEATPVTCPQPLLDSRTNLINRPDRFLIEDAYRNPDGKWATDARPMDLWEPRVWLFKSVPGMPDSSSWNITHVPVWAYTRKQQNSAAAITDTFNVNLRATLRTKRYPPHAYEPTTMHVVDAPIHVTCVDDVFVVMVYYWALYPTRNLIMSLLGGNGTQTLGETNMFDSGNTIFYYGPLIGTPPTVYTTLVDNRRFSAMNILAYREWYGLPRTKPARLTDFTGITKSGLVTQETHMHDEIVLPHYCREAFIHNSYDYRGRHMAASDDTYTDIVTYDICNVSDGTVFKDTEHEDIVAPAKLGVSIIKSSAGDGEDEPAWQSVVALKVESRASDLFHTAQRLPLDAPPTAVDGVVQVPRDITADSFFDPKFYFHATENRLLYSLEGYPLRVPGAYPCYGRGIRYSVQLGEGVVFSDIDSVILDVGPAFGAHPFVAELHAVAEDPIETKTNTYSPITDQGAYASRDFDVWRAEQPQPHQVIFIIQGEKFGWDLPADESSMSARFRGAAHDYSERAIRDETQKIWVHKDYSTVRVYCPGLALKDQDPSTPYIPEFNNNYFARMFTVAKTDGASMGYSTVGTFAMYLKTDHKLNGELETENQPAAGFGALPAGLTLYNGDIVCYVGELKDG